MRRVPFRRRDVLILTSRGLQGGVWDLEVASFSAEGLWYYRSSGGFLDGTDRFSEQC